MNFPADLLEFYSKTIKVKFDSGLGIFYREDGDDDISTEKTEMRRIEKAVEKHEKTFID